MILNIVGLLFFGGLTLLFGSIVFSLLYNFHGEHEERWVFYCFSIVLFLSITFFSFSAFVFQYDLVFKKIEKTIKEKATIHYFNNSIYCSGSYWDSVIVERAFYYLPRHYDVDTIKKRIGYWEFFYPSGVLSGEQWYDQYGNILEGKNYRSNGLLQEEYAYTRKNKNSYSYINRHYENGIISEESQKEYLRKGDEEEQVLETKTEFYPNGMKESCTTYLNRKRKSSIKWDSLGMIVLKLKYFSDDKILIDSI